MKYIASCLFAVASAMFALSGCKPDLGSELNGIGEYEPKEAACVELIAEYKDVHKNLTEKVLPAYLSAKRRFDQDNGKETEPAAGKESKSPTNSVSSAEPTAPSDSDEIPSFEGSLGLADAAPSSIQGVTGLSLPNLPEELTALGEDDGKCLDLYVGGNSKEVEAACIAVIRYNAAGVKAQTSYDSNSACRQGQASQQQHARINFSAYCRSQCAFADGYCSACSFDYDGDRGQMICGTEEDARQASDQFCQGRTCSELSCNTKVGRAFSSEANVDVRDATTDGQSETSIDTFEAFVETELEAEAGILVVSAGTKVKAGITVQVSQQIMVSNQGNLAPYDPKTNVAFDKTYVTCSYKLARVSKASIAAQVETGVDLVLVKGTAKTDIGAGVEIENNMERTMAPFPAGGQSSNQIYDQCEGFFKNNLTNDMARIVSNLISVGARYSSRTRDDVVNYRFEKLIGGREGSYYHGTITTLRVDLSGEKMTVKIHLDYDFGVSGPNDHDETYQIERLPGGGFQWSGEGQSGQDGDRFSNVVDGLTGTNKYYIMKYLGFFGYSSL